MTPMQYKVFRKLCWGLPVNAIATQLGRSQFTIRNHLKAIFQSFNVHSQTELLARAIASGVILQRSRRYQNHSPKVRLTPRQVAVLVRLLQGLPLPEIAGQLGISPFTVRGHMKALFRSFRVGSRPQLMAATMRGQSRFDRFVAPESGTCATRMF
jgi:DNA-binding NarL/FixJ family response regulator